MALLLNGEASVEDFVAGCPLAASKVMCSEPRSELGPPPELKLATGQPLPAPDLEAWAILWWLT